jgi:hypothetical protein
VRLEGVDGPVLVAPQPCGLERASGTVPTRRGPVEVEWRVADERLTVSVEAPEGLEIRCVAPAEYEGRTDFTGVE